MLDQLEILHQVYLGELHRESEGYRNIHSYFTRLGDSSSTESDSELELVSPIQRSHL